VSRSAPRIDSPDNKHALQQPNTLIQDYSKKQLRTAHESTIALHITKTYSYASAIQSRHRNGLSPAIGQGGGQLPQGDCTAGRAHPKATRQCRRQQQGIYVEAGGLHFDNLESSQLMCIQKQALAETRNVLPSMQTKISAALEKLEEALVSALVRY
jgi:hypothetical protein